MATNNFDFEAYNAVMKNANSGLKLYLAEQLLSDVQSVMYRFKSPLREDITSIVDELGSLREANKKYLANRDKTTDGTIDNENLPTTDAPKGKSYQNKHGDKQESHVEAPL